MTSDDTQALGAAAPEPEWGVGIAATPGGEDFGDAQELIAMLRSQLTEYAVEASRLRRRLAEMEAAVAGATAGGASANAGGFDDSDTVDLTESVTGLGDAYRLHLRTGASSPAWAEGDLLTMLAALPPVRFLPRANDSLPPLHRPPVEPAEA